MIRAKITEKGVPFSQLKEALTSRIENANAELGRQFAANISDEAAAGLPTGGWFTIYREAIKFFESADGQTWAAAGLWPQSFSTFPGDSTLVTFGGDSTVAGIMAQQNPWPITMIPAIAAGYRATAKARHASSVEMERERKRIDPVLEDVKSALVAAGGAIQVNTFPTIAGTIYADIGFLALRLEHGLGGLPRIPVWARAFRRAQVNAPKWAAQARPRVEQILRGSESASPIDAMPEQLRKAIQAHRR